MQITLFVDKSKVAGVVPEITEGTCGGIRITEVSRHHHAGRRRPDGDFSGGSCGYFVVILIENGKRVVLGRKSTGAGLVRSVEGIPGDVAAFRGSVNFDDLEPETFLEPFPNRGCRAAHCEPSRIIRIVASFGLIP